MAEAASPLKAFEYLAAGLPVVSTRIADLEGLPGLVWTAEDAAGLVAGIEEADEAGVETGAWQAVARQRSWDALAGAFLSREPEAKKLGLPMQQHDERQPEPIMVILVLLGIFLSLQHWWRTVGRALLGDVFAAAIPIALAAIALGGILLLALAVLRLRQRARRAAALLTREILLGPDDQATPAQVAGLFDAIAAGWTPRYLRWLLGQDWLVIELRRSKRDEPLHILVTAPEHRMDALQGALRSVYPHVRLGRDRSLLLPPSADYATVLTLGDRHALPLRSQRDYTVHALEAVASAIDAAEGSVSLQFVLVPQGSSPRTLKQHIRAMESAANLAALTNAGPGAGGTVESKESHAAIETAGHGWFDVQIRILSETVTLADDICGALARAHGQNTFVRHTVYLGRGLLRRWSERNLPALWPFSSMRLSSVSLASILALPSGRLRTESLTRMAVRRAPVPISIPQVRRDEAWVCGADARNRFVAVLESDRRFNALALGTQGSGKSTLLQLVFLTDVRVRTKCTMLLDTKGDLAEGALGMVPPERHVVYFAPGTGARWGLNPLAGPERPDVKALNLVDAFQQIFGAESVGPKSREYLTNATLAVLSACRRPTLDDVYRFLGEPAYRQELIPAIRDPFVRRYWSEIFAQQEALDPGFTVSSLSPILNKLNQILSIAPLRETFTSGHPIDVDRIIRNRSVLICDLSKHRLTEPGANLVAAFLVAAIWQAILRQGAVPEEARVPVSIIADEAANYLTPSFATLLAEGRAYGAQATIAFQFLKQLTDPRLREAVWSLCQNVFLFQTRDPEDAERFSHLAMRIHLNQFSRELENQSVYLFDPHDFQYLPSHTCVAILKVNGVQQPAFLAETIYEPRAYHKDWAAFHKRSNGAMPGSDATPPDERMEAEL